MKTVQVSVRHLVEFILRSGDIDSSRGGLQEIDAMQQGSKMHRKLQKEAGPSYRAEVSLQHYTYIDEELEILVEGRADGVITESELGADADGLLVLKDKITIDEIKGTYRNLNHITEPVQEHLAQAKCYAYFYAVGEGLSEISVQMTYVHLEKGRIKRFTEKYDVSELEIWYQVLIEKYATWVKWEMDWIRQRNASIGSCQFPFAYRDSQRKLIAGVYQTILRKKRFFVQAPTGTGKTIATIYPTVQAMGGLMADKIFYLTAKTIARTVAEDTFALLQDRGLSMKVITLTAKDKICIYDKAQCSPLTCPRAAGHFDRVNEAVFDMINHEDRMTRENIEKYADKHCVCPFEMQLDVSLWCDAIVCDYNYVFDPDVALKRYFSDGNAGQYVFLVDESHNLVDRAREMYSAVLELERLEGMKKALRGVDKKLSERLGKCIRYMETARDESEITCEVSDNIGGLIIHLTKLMQSLEGLLKEEVDAQHREVMTDLYFDVRGFIHAFERSDDRYLIYRLREENRFTIKIFCVDPSKDLGERLKLGRSAVFFSATLLPVQYYKDMLSDSAGEDYDLYVESPFDPSRRLLVAADDVSSRYTRRGPKEYEKMATYIRDIIRAKHGNYMIFFPSYQMMHEVFEIFAQMEIQKAGHGLNLVVQESDMSEDARQAFLDAFVANAAENTIGFCVMGGIFSEGIDLKEDRLIGAIIVGTGLPQVGPERELLNRYFNEKCDSGFEYAYLYPGMNKVLQAGGRVIRTEQDAGVIALLDERFNYSQYKQVFPREWTDCKKTSLTKIGKQVEDFWTEI